VRGFELLLVVTSGLLVLAVVEILVHRRNLRRLPVRIHVNGTRGKSSVTRLIAGGLRAGGVSTCAKTTGTLARMILPDGHEYPVFRPSKPNVIEQVRIVAAAAAAEARALVIECMALQPELQWLSESKLVRATHAVITNARPDHLDVMGPTESDVARALCGMVPPGGKLFTTERRQLAILEEACRDRRCELLAVGDEELAAVTPEEMAGFCYTEHPDNVALALRVCQELGVDRQTALRGMWDAAPDPGVLTEHAIDYFGRRLIFVNGFAANDPVSTEQIWNLALDRHPAVERRVAVFNCRADRADRSLQLGRACVRWRQPDHLVLMGTGTYIFARAAVSAGLDASKLVFLEGRGVADIFEATLALVQRSALVMGMGNIGGEGLALARYFRNRSAPPPLEVAAVRPSCDLRRSHKESA
jgi:poly-gamma-glutamate synthase PgsB/CapB